MISNHDDECIFGDSIADFEKIGFRKLNVFQRNNKISGRKFVLILVISFGISRSADHRIGSKLFQNLIDGVRSSFFDEKFGDSIAEKISLFVRIDPFENDSARVRNGKVLISLFGFLNGEFRSEVFLHAENVSGEKFMNHNGDQLDVQKGIFGNDVPDTVFVSEVDIVVDIVSRHQRIKNVRKFVLDRFDQIQTGFTGHTNIGDDQMNLFAF